MRKSLQSQSHAQNLLLDNQTLLSKGRFVLSDIPLALSARRCRICLDLSRIYPIESLDETLGFSIRGVKLLSAGKWDGNGEEEVAAPLGWWAHSEYLLSLYSGVPLPYPVQPVWGRGLVRDPVSITMGSRMYHSSPLWCG